MTAASVAGGGLFANAVTGGSFPNGFGAVEVCITDNANSCRGGQNGGVGLDRSGVTQLTLQLPGLGRGVDLSNFGVRYLSLTSRPLGLDDDSSTGGRAPHAGLRPAIPARPAARGARAARGGRPPPIVRVPQK